MAGYLAAFLLCAALLVNCGAAGAVTLAKLNGAAPQLRLCPKASCPAVAAGPIGSGGMVPVFEFSGSFARVGPYMSREAAAARFSGVDAGGLPDNPALWIARAQISTGDAATDLAAVEAPEEAPKPQERRIRPARLPVPEPSPRKLAFAAKPAAQPAVDKPSTELKMPAASSLLATTPPSLEPAPLPGPPKPAPVEQAAAAPAPEKPADKPDTLTPELMDKRLKVLPSRPNADFTMAQVVALRRQGLAYLEEGACTGIKEGGKTLTPGFLYLVCDGDEAWRQFAQ